MTEPAFEEFDPAGECDCAGCVHWRRAMPGTAGGASGAARHPAGARVVTVTAAAATAMTAAPVTAAAVAPAAVAAPANQGAPAVPATGGSDGPAPQEAEAAEADAAEGAAEAVTGYGTAAGMTAAGMTAAAGAGQSADGPQDIVPAVDPAQAEAAPGEPPAERVGVPRAPVPADGTEVPQGGGGPAVVADAGDAASPAAEGEATEASPDGGAPAPAAVADAGGSTPAPAAQGEVTQIGAAREDSAPEVIADAEVTPHSPAAEDEVRQIGTGRDSGAPAAVPEAGAGPPAPAVQDGVPQVGAPKEGGSPGAGDREVTPHAPAAHEAAAVAGGGAPDSVVREEAARVGVREGGGVRPPVVQGTVATAGSGGVRAVAAPRSGGTRVASAPETAAGARDRAGLRPVSRGEIIERARRWTEAGVPYDMERNWADGYRQDCSGFVSMAWGLPGNAWTGNLDDYAVRISHEELSPGDILLFHNDADPQTGSHVVIFGGWTDYTHTRYVAYEQTRPHAVRRVLDHPYPVNGDRYVPYRYRALAPGGGSAEEAAFPGRASFGPGATNAHVTRLGRMLVERGGARFYAGGPGPRWGDADRRAVQAFQRAQGWVGKEADGLPGPHTWQLLVTGRGRDIPPPGTPSSHGVTGYPGRAAFRPGAKNAYVTQLGRQLVRKGYGRHYTDGPGPEWTDADRRAVQAFQRAQGWRGGAADGYPGPETWRRLFS